MNMIPVPQNDSVFRSGLKGWARILNWLSGNKQRKIKLFVTVACLVVSIGIGILFFKSEVKKQGSAPNTVLVLSYF